MGVFCRMDAMVGEDFEHGLTSLKALPEKSQCRGIVRLDLIV